MKAPGNLEVSLSCHTEGCCEIQVVWSREVLHKPLNIHSNNVQMVDFFILRSFNKELPTIYGCLFSCFMLA